MQFVENESQFAQAMTDFANRGIQQVIVEEHLEGDLIKFYGVEGSAFSTLPTLPKREASRSLVWKNKTDSLNTLVLMLTS